MRRDISTIQREKDTHQVVALGHSDDLIRQRGRQHAAGRVVYRIQIQTHGALSDHLLQFALSQ